MANTKQVLNYITVQAADTTPLALRFAEQDATGKVILAGANKKALGVVEEGEGGVAANEYMRVATHGIINVETGGAVNPGDPVTSDSVGRAVAVPSLTIGAGGTTVTSTAANGAIINGGKPLVAINGYAIDVASGSGKFIRVRLA